MKKRTYVAPVIKSEAIQVGVFGSYGSVSSSSLSMPSFLSIGNRKKHKPCS